MRQRKAGYYIFTRLSNGRTEVHGGPHKTIKEAIQSIFNGLRVTRSAIDCEIEYWSASGIERRKSILDMPKEPSNERR